MEDKELKELTRKKIISNRLKIILDIVLIVLILAIAFYIIREIELFKMLNQDVCKYCMEKTGAVCYNLM